MAMEEQAMMGLDGSTWHYCPVADCQVRVANVQLMCSKHWRLVPKDLAREVYRQWRQGNPTIFHRAACRAAVEAVNEQLAPRPAGG